ncbi:MAG TPA: histidine kinase [Mycobacteriales bacterium]|nr:histidine kinase [Mycobacteriales bacterium]
MPIDRRRIGRRVRSSRVVRRAMVAYLLLGLVALLAIGSGTYLTSRAVARSDALRDAERVGAAVADLLVRPLLDGALAGQPNQLNELDRALAAQVHDGSIERIWVWDRSGRLRYANQRSMIGLSFPLPDPVTRAIVEDASSVGVCDSADLPAADQLPGPRLVQVVLPLQLDPTTRLAMAAYFDYSPVGARAAALTRQMFPMMLAVLAVLQVVQVPIAYSLAVRVSRHQDERGRLLRRALEASERERRRIARDLHDGVVADLAGVGYVLSAVQEASLPEQQRGLVSRAGTVVRDAVAALRTVMVEIYPPDLAAGGLARAVEELTQPLRDQGLRVSLTLDLPGDLPASAAAAIYRFARETLRNVADHSRASRVRVVLRHQRDRVLLWVDDDGVGLPESGIDRRGEGHLGLRLLADSVGDLGGGFEATTSDLGGVSIRVSIPLGELEEHVKA